MVADAGLPRNAPAAHMRGFLSRDGMPPGGAAGGGPRGGRRLRRARTSVPGVWVAGNAANPRAQVVTAAGEGSSAAIAINADLVEEDVHIGIRGSRPAPPA